MPLQLQLVRGVGSRVMQILKGTPLDLAGLRADDVIVSIADTRSPTPAEVHRALADTPAGEFILIVVRRGEGRRVMAVDVHAAADVRSR